MVDRDLLQASDINFAKALSLVDSDSDPRRKLWSQIGIATAQYKAGIDSTSLLDDVSKASNSLKPEERAFVNFRLAQAFSEVGRVDKAKSLVRKEPPFDAGDSTVWLAIIKAERGAEPTSIETAIAIAQTRDSRGYLAFSRIAETQHDLGLDPSLTLKKAQDAIEKAPVGIPKVAEAYAYCSLFEQSLKLAAKMRPDPINKVTRDDIKEVYFNIAENMVRDGEGDLAVSTIGRVKDNLLTTKILAETAVADFQRDLDPKPRIEDGLKHAKKIQAKRPEFERPTQGYASIAAAQARCGLDATQTLAVAFGKLNKISEASSRVNALFSILPAKYYMGLDLRDEIKLTLEWVDKMSGATDTTEIEQPLMKAELAVFASSGNYFDEALAIAESLDGYPVISRSGIYAEIAKYQRLKAMQSDN